MAKKKKHWREEIIGMDIDLADGVISQRGYAPAAFKFDEEIDLSEIDRQKEWVVMLYDNDHKVISSHEVLGLDGPKPYIVRDENENE